MWKEGGFKTRGSNAEDGRLTDAITWSSSRDGALGTGMILQLDTLSPGGHQICASATDGDTDASYAVPVLGPSGTFVPPGVFRACDWTAPWSSTEFLNADPDAVPGAPPTPGQTNPGCPCPGDLDGSGTVGTPDFLALLAAWGDCP